MNKKNIYIMYALALLQGMVFYAPIATLYRQAAGVSIFEITIIESISLAISLLLELPWGIVADKIGYKKAMIICCVLYFISKIVFFEADGFLMFLVERIMLAVVVSGLSGVDTSILYLSCGKDDSHRVFSLYGSLMTVGLLFSSLIYSLFVGNNYRLAGFLTVISYAVAAVLSLFLDEVSSPDEKKLNAHDLLPLLKRTAANKYFVLFLIAIAFFNEAHQTITTFLNQLKYIVCGISTSAIGIIYIAATLIGLLGIFSARVTKKLGVGLSSAIYFLAAITSCFFLAITNSGFLAVAAILVLRLASSLFLPLQTELQNKLVVSKNRATELSINALLIDSIGIGTNVVFGKLADINLTSAFWLGAALCAVAAVLFFLWYKRSFSCTEK